MGRVVWDWLRTMEVAIAASVLALVGLVVFVWAEPAENYFDARFMVEGRGPDPVVRYTREILFTQKMEWIAETHEIDAGGELRANIDMCSGGGSSLYQTDEPKQFDMALSRFVGNKDCQLGPGRYVTTVCWRMQPLMFVTKTLCRRADYEIK